MLVIDNGKKVVGFEIYLEVGIIGLTDSLNLGNKEEGRFMKNQVSHLSNHIYLQYEKEKTLNMSLW